MIAERRNEVGLSLDKILNSFLENHFVESVEIDLGIVDDRIGYSSIKIRAPKKNKLRAFFSYYNSQLVSHRLDYIRIIKDRSDEIELSVYTFYPRQQPYSREQYDIAVIEALRKIPHFLRDFRQKKL